MKEEDFDFGFSLVDETELKEQEEKLRSIVEKQTQTTEEIKDRLNGLRDMIMPLLKNLAKDPDKSYIHWPNRVEQIEKFIKKIDNYIKK